MNRLFCSLYSSVGHRAPVKQIFEKGYFSRPFDAARKKLLFLYVPNNMVAFSQLNPFLFYESNIAADFDVSIRAIPTTELENSPLRDADVVCLQTSFNLSEFEANELFQAIGQYHPRAKRVYFDWFAPLDLRLAKILDPHVDLYVKRQVFQDLRQYSKPTQGDTNLMDHYCREYNLECDEYFFPVPVRFYQKLILGPGLFTGSYLLNDFSKGRFKDRIKNVDVHARFGYRGTPWYTAMRNEALQACKDLNHDGVLIGNGVSRKQYLDELSRSKMCFSPFGYGEVCWRDFESILLGSLLIKPDMTHVRTNPDIYINNETYVPIAWDLSDLQEKVEFYVNNAFERQRMVGNARQIIGDYVKNNGFLKQMSPVFHLAHDELVIHPTAYKVHLDSFSRITTGDVPVTGMAAKTGATLSAARYR